MPHTPQELIEEFWKKLADSRFIKSTDSVTGEMEEMDGGVTDMEAVIEIHGQFDKDELDKYLLSAFTRLQAESYEQAAKICDGMKGSFTTKIDDKTYYLGGADDALTQAAEEIRKAKE